MADHSNSAVNPILIPALDSALQTPDMKALGEQICARAIQRMIDEKATAQHVLSFAKEAVNYILRSSVHGSNLQIELYSDKFSNVRVSLYETINSSTPIYPSRLLVWAKTIPYYGRVSVLLEGAKNETGSESAHP